MNNTNLPEEDDKDTSRIPENQDPSINHTETQDIPPEIQEIQQQISGAVDRSINDPAQLVSAAISELQRMGIILPPDAVELITKRANILSRVDADEDFSDEIDFESAVLAIVKDHALYGQKIRSLVSSLEENTPEDARKKAENLKKKIEELEKFGATKDEINWQMQNEITAALSELGTLRAQAQKPVIEKTREIVRSPFYVKILSIALAIVLVFSIYQNLKQRDLIDKIKNEHVPMLIGQRELDWDKIEKDIKDWTKQYETQYPNRPATADELKAFLNRLLPESRKGQSKLIRAALESALLSRDLKLAYEQTRDLRRDSEQARDQMIRASRDMVIMSTDLMKSLGSAWLAWGVAARDPNYGRFFPNENREKFLNAINDLLKKIQTEMENEQRLGAGVPRPWKEDTERLTALKNSIDALRQNNCQLDESTRQFIMSYE